MGTHVQQVIGQMDNLHFGGSNRIFRFIKREKKKCPIFRFASSEKSQFYQGVLAGRILLVIILS